MSLTYRPEVDGLRCIAVLVVILHHLNITWFSGGFVGVDVFFVISGYLITGILLKELKSVTFSFGNFYKRRVIRLAPAYFAVILVTALVASVLMLPPELENFSVSALYSTLFASNFYMWDTVGGYFGSGGATTPLLHLWSLAVEEQFYIVWPVTILILSRLISRAGMLFAVVLALVFTLIISEWGVVNYPAAAYYLMPTRAFELLLGAVLAFFPIAVLASLPLALRMVLSGLGLTLILYASVAFTSETSFPGVNALVPCMGTFLLIAFVHADDRVFSFLLSNPVAVMIGKVSYPAYLWHWPIIAFLNIQLVELTPITAFAVLGATIILAFLTYQFIEIPAHGFRKVPWHRVIFAGFVLPSAVLSVGALSVIELNGMPWRFDESLTNRSKAVLASASDIRGRCNEGTVKSPLGPGECILGVDKPEVDILVLGDSHANTFTGMIDVLAQDAHLRGYDVTQSNSPFLVNVDRYYTKNGELFLHRNFRIRNDFIESQLIPRSYKFVVLAGAFVSHFERGLFSDDGMVAEQSRPDVFSDAMSETIELIVSKGSIPVLIKGNAIFDFDISHCTLNNLRFDLDQNCNMKLDDYQKKFSRWSALLDALQAKFSNLIVIDPSRVMCDESVCYSELEGTPLYKDSGHLNYEGSKLIGRLYLRQVNNPFLVKENG